MVDALGLEPAGPRLVFNRLSELLEQLQPGVPETGMDLAIAVTFGVYLGEFIQILLLVLLAMQRFPILSAKAVTLAISTKETKADIRQHQHRPNRLGSGF